MDLKLETTPFKTCAVCGFVWPTRKDFLTDTAVEIIGYQVNFDALTLGIFLFNHSCANTLAVPAGAFKDLYDGPIFAIRATGTEQCPGYCLRQNELRPCPAQCECAYVRQIIQIIIKWPKNPFKLNDDSTLSTNIKSKKARTNTPVAGN